MKKILCIVSFLCALYAHGQTVTAIASSKGIAPIPAFIRNEPCGMVFIDTKLSKHLQFAPDVTFSLQDWKLWFSDMWLRYNFTLDSAKRWNATIGIDMPSYFGQSFTARSAEKIDQIVLYPTGQLKLQYVLKDSNTLTLDYWYTQATKLEYGVKGSYLSLSYGFTKQLKMFCIRANPNVFFLKYSDGTKGFAGSVDVSCTHKKTGIFVSAQGLTPITVNNVTATWNISLGITRKLL